MSVLLVMEAALMTVSILKALLSATVQLVSS